MPPLRTCHALKTGFVEILNFLEVVIEEIVANI